MKIFMYKLEKNLALMISKDNRHNNNIILHINNKCSICININNNNNFIWIQWCSPWWIWEIWVTTCNINLKWTEEEGIWVVEAIEEVTEEVTTEIIINNRTNNKWCSKINSNKSLMIMGLIKLILKFKNKM